MTDDTRAPSHAEGALTDAVKRLVGELRASFHDIEGGLTPLEERCMRLLERLASRPAPAAVPEGWVLVPVEPTQAMLRAHCENADGLDEFSARRDWRAMLAAATQPQSAGKEGT